MTFDRLLAHSLFLLLLFYPLLLFCLSQVAWTKWPTGCPHSQSKEGGTWVQGGTTYGPDDSANFAGLSSLFSPEPLSRSPSYTHTQSANGEGRADATGQELG